MMQHSENISQLTYGKKTLNFNLTYSSDATNWSVTILGISDATFMPPSVQLLTEGEKIVFLLMESVKKRAATGAEMMRFTKKIINEICEYMELKTMWDLSIRAIIREWEVYVRDYNGMNQMFDDLPNTMRAPARALPILPCRMHSEL